MIEAEFSVNMKGPVTEPLFSERRLNRALGHVGTHWFPINSEVLSIVKAGLENGAYELDIGFLISDLKSDFALFSFCIKELSVIASNQNASNTIMNDPIALLHWGGLIRLKAILSDDAYLPSTHKLSDADDSLQNRLRETAICASTVELLNEHNKADGETGFCHAIIRQVGLNLIAWNYPTVYSRVVRELTKARSLEDALSHELGFSPALLAMRLLKRRLSKNGAKEDSSLTQTAYLDSLCEIGEALARANNPSQYPSAERDWTDAEKFLRTTIGSSAIELIQLRVEENTAKYQDTLPSLTSDSYRLDPAKNIRTLRASKRSSENPSIKACPATIKNALINLYAEMPIDEVSRNAIEKLIKQVVPIAGFSGGCIYLIDPTTMSLVPRTIIRNVCLRRLTSLTIHSSKGSALGPLLSDSSIISSEGRRDAAVHALERDHPLIERSSLEGLENSLGVYASIGDRRRIGVLYLEKVDSKSELDDATTLKIFKAILKTLEDALLVS